jgi:hypothetical protein
VEIDPTRMCELMVGLPEVHILGVDDQVNDFLCIYIESRAQRPGVPTVAFRTDEGSLGGRAG